MIALCFCFLFCHNFDSHKLRGIRHETSPATTDVLIATEARKLVWHSHTKQNMRHKPAPIRQFSNNLYLLIQQLQNSFELKIDPGEDRFLSAVFEVSLVKGYKSS